MGALYIDVFWKSVHVIHSGFFVDFEKLGMTSVIFNFKIDFPTRFFAKKRVGKRSFFKKMTDLEPNFCQKIEKHEWISCRSRFLTYVKQ